MEQQRALSQKLHLKGRIIIAPEGINGTVEGLTEDTEKYILETLKIPEFKDMNFKKSDGTGDAFPKLSVKVRKEIVAADLGKDDVDPTQVTGKYLSPDELHQWLENQKDFVIVDMRNDYEYKSGHFEGSINPGLTQFRDLPNVLPKLQNLKGKTVVTVCTGGVRCEKASGYLVSQGFKDVYQLHNGIVSYMEKYPNKHYKGKLYVFDNRLVMGFETDTPAHEILGSCDLCGTSSDNYVNCAWDPCHKHYISCDDCYHDSGLPFCSLECVEKYREKNVITF
jgi:UPF0176 protein